MLLDVFIIFILQKNYKLMSLICDSLTNLHNDFNKINYQFLMYQFILD